MNIADFVDDNENNDSYRRLEASNLDRHYDFLHSVILASIGIGKLYISSAIVKALNHQAIVSLHANAGQYRPMEVHVADEHGNTLFEPPPSFKVSSLMDDCVNWINLRWRDADAIELATWALWRINHIHPFVNGNGRTARAVCYFILCVKAGHLLPGDTILPDLLRRNPDDCVEALRLADQGDFTPLQEIVSYLLVEQLGSNNRSS